MLASSNPLSRRRLLRGVSAGILASPAIVRAQAEKRLRLAHALPRSHPVHGAIERFAGIVHERSGGALAVDVFADGELGQEVQLFEQAQLGRLDLVKASASVVERAAPAFQVFNLPFVLRDRDHWQRVVAGPIGEGILASAAPWGLVGLTFYEAGSRSFYAQKPIDHPDALKGMRIRVQPSPTMVRLIKLFGAEPVQLPWDVTYDALGTGLVDGAENSVVALVVGRHGQVVKYYSFDEHTMVPDVLLASAKCWDALPGAHRQIVREAAALSHDHMNGLWKTFAAEARRTVEAMGVIFTTPDKAPFIARAGPMTPEFGDNPMLVDLVSRIRDA